MSALSYLYLSETRGSFEIARERPGSDKEECFGQLRRCAGETKQDTENRPVRTFSILSHLCISSRQNSISRCRVLIAVERSHYT